MLVKGYSASVIASKNRGWRCYGENEVSSGSPFEKSVHLLLVPFRVVESPVKKACLSTIQADLSCTPQFMKAL